MRAGYVYIMASVTGTLYVGVTSGLKRRVWQHKQKKYGGSTARYDVHKLVYYESFEWIRNAIRREKQIKGWTRAKKTELVRSKNPEWKDLSEGWYD